MRPNNAYNKTPQFRKTENKNFEEKQEVLNRTIPEAEGVV